MSDGARAGYAALLAKLPPGSFQIHSSAIAHEDFVILFLGASGAGKTTAARNAADGDESVILHEDSGFVHLQGNSAILVPDPGTTKNPHPPLQIRYAFEIVQSRDFFVEPMPRLQQLLRISRSVIECLMNAVKPADERVELLDRARAMADRIGVYRLHLPNRPGFLPQLFDELHRLENS